MNLQRSLLHYKGENYLRLLKFMDTSLNYRGQNRSKSNNFWIKVKNITKLSPPEDSVALEYIDANYEYLYSGKEKAQQIYKSVWFELKDDEDDSDFFEYCIPTKQYETIISVIWKK